VSIREAAAKGTFYPENPKALASDVELYLSHASATEITGDIKGLIAPHAGYIYSGAVAAWAYKPLIKRTYDTVVVIAPSHRSYFEGVAVQEQGGYRMPLGIIKIDTAFTAKLLKKSSLVQANIHAHQGEHSLEVQLPFLQVVLNDFLMVPLIMGTQDVTVCQELAAAIVDVMQETKKRVLVIGSTDLSHYYPYNQALELDMQLARNLEHFDIQGLTSDLADGKCEACGAGPMITTMMVSKETGANASKVLKYANSGDVSGDKTSVVGYISAVFYKAGNT
jgi:MEMO1 family protein